MALQTKGFVNARQRNRHFSEHGADFGASNPNDYEALADIFLSGLTPVGIQECKRKQGDKLRYDPKTESYGVLDTNGLIRTFFKPIPCITVPASARAAMKQSGRCHSYTNDVAYFQAECKRWW
jgi:hypothetical protein